MTKSSAVSLLVLAALAVQLMTLPQTTLALGLGLNLPNPLGNLTNTLTNLTSPLLSPLTNLTSPLLSPLNPILNNLTTPILSPVDNLTATPVSTNVTAQVGGFNLTTIIGSLNNITGNLSPLLSNLTGPLQAALKNLTGPATNLTVATNVTITVTLNLPPTALPNPNILNSFPNSVTISPLGVTEVSFTVRGLPGTNLTSVPVTIMVPTISYLGFPVSGSAGLTMDIPVGTNLAVSGITSNVTRLFFGVSWQTFPQLTSVLISKILPDSNELAPLYTLPIPALM